VLSGDRSSPLYDLGKESVEDSLDLLGALGLLFLGDHDIHMDVAITDSAYRIAHDEVIIIDETRVITGAFNFTRSTEDYNAKNMLIISSNPPLADQHTIS